MAISDRRHRIVKLLWRRMRIVALLVLVVLAASALWNIYGKDQESLALRKQSEEQLRDLSAQQTTLQSNIEKLQTARGQEETLRDQYAVGKAGENLIVIVEPQHVATTSSGSGFLDLIHKFLPFW